MAEAKWSGFFGGWIVSGVFVISWRGGFVFLGGERTGAGDEGYEAGEVVFDEFAHGCRRVVVGLAWRRWRVICAGWDAGGVVTFEDCSSTAALWVA